MVVVVPSIDAKPLATTEACAFGRTGNNLRDDLDLLLCLCHLLDNLCFGGMIKNLIGCAREAIGPLSVGVTGFAREGVAKYRVKSRASLGYVVLQNEYNGCEDDITNYVEK
ncbi:hypothetical protein GOP47_0010534 [Adiantum capillus-veneris]|uniref:Uncharacterized protein n=1 Tax=Adiantum capillus-veneris TaxID=13818 RepID=A0A9D4ZGF9_ADICA|nr:hypothetical protein GOP47_0010534 [Adiantum capillus-veneris]